MSIENDSQKTVTLDQEATIENLDPTELPPSNTVILGRDIDLSYHFPLSIEKIYGSEREERRERWALSETGNRMKDLLNEWQKDSGNEFFDKLIDYVESGNIEAGLDAIDRIVMATLEDPLEYQRREQGKRCTPDIEEHMFYVERSEGDFLGLDIVGIP